MNLRPLFRACVLIRTAQVSSRCKCLPLLRTSAGMNAERPKIDHGCAPCERLTGVCAVSYTKRNAMYILLLILHIIVCLFLIVVVLLQSGKAADLAGAFGGMGS